MLIINAQIFPVEGAPIGRGYIEIKNGKIAGLGPMEQAPDTAEEIYDAAGARVYPGFIDAHTHLGMWEDALALEGDDGNEDTDPQTPQLRALDAVNPLDRGVSEALAAGVTTVMTGPGSANPVAGQMLVMKTYGVCVDDMVLKEPAALKCALGENPKMVYHGKNQAPVTRMATAALIRESFLKARDYQEQKEKAREEDDPFDFDFKCESLLPALNREIPVHFHAHRADDLFTALRIAREFHLDHTLIHATEGGRIAERLGREKAQVIVGPALCDRSKPELKELSFETAGLLQRSGCLVAITTDHPETPAQYLPLCAALCVKAGMDEGEALKAITINAAKICKVEDRVGSIQKGKDADLVVIDKSPFDLSAKVLAVLVDGKIVGKEGKAL